MIAYFRPISEDVVPTLSSYDDDQIAEYLFPAEEQDDDLDIDKAWHAIHFVLTGSAEPCSGPLGSAVLGGTPIGPDLGYGAARWLTVGEVKEVSEALPDPSELQARFDRAALGRADVYPQIWDEEDGELVDYVVSNYAAMRDAYRLAARRAQAMLIWLA